MDEEGPELVAEPERPIRRQAEGFDVEIGAREQAALANSGIHRNRAARIRLAVGDDAEADPVVGVTQVVVQCHADGSRPAQAGREVRREPVDGQDEVGGVRLGAEAVVGHREVAAVLRA
jgi:hypothetical protein